MLKPPSKPKLAVPFNRPHVTGAEFGYIQEAIDNGQLSGNGDFTRRCTELLARELGVPAVLLTHSCTGALEMAALLAGVAHGDEVIMPSFTFSSTATAFALRGATPVFVDIRPDTLNMDEALVKSAITHRTKAIVPVHYAGIGCNMDVLCSIANEHGVPIIEDAAQGLGSSFRGQPLGSFGSLGALSFHETKNVICGEGGALVIKDQSLLERAEILHEKGTNRRAFFRGQVDKYTWVDLGSSFLASEMAAAFLWAQLERVDAITAKRLAIWDRYHQELGDLEADGLLRRPIIPRDVGHNAHLYYVLLPDERTRNRVLDSLVAAGVGAVFHYVPLHSSPAGRALGRMASELPVTDDVSASLLRLPLWVGMGDGEVTHVIESLRAAVL